MTKVLKISDSNLYIRCIVKREQVCHISDTLYWTIFRNHDCQGNDISRHQTTSLQGCKDVCDGIPECMGLAYVETWVGEDNCFVKPVCNPSPDGRDIGLLAVIKSMCSINTNEFSCFD